MVIQPINDIAEICARHGIKQAVLCPGSRCAPLVLAFSRHLEIETFVIPDERAAAYIALGMSQASKLPVVLVCTSGTAAINLYPGIAEAYYQKVPLLVFTADRPPEWVDQQDGQAIQQSSIYGKHIIKSYDFPTSLIHDDEVWHATRIINEANVLTKAHTGPIHINVPIREPFYPDSKEAFSYSEKVAVIDAVVGKSTSNLKSISDKMLDNLDQAKKVLIVAGQGRYSIRLTKLLAECMKKFNWVVIGDITANIHDLDNAISNHDMILGNVNNHDSLKPDLLISFGESVLSKALKNFLRDSSPTDHWRLNEMDDLVDVFKCLTNNISSIDPISFFTELHARTTNTDEENRSYARNWLELDKKAMRSRVDFFEKEKEGELSFVRVAINHMPKGAVIHLANSMSVRYANCFTNELPDNTMVFSNRGTSGIDGCASTAVGYAINSSRPNILITGDMAFFYDRNAFWHNYIPGNLKIIMLNNHGGGIFGLIDGPKQLPERDELFITSQQLKAKNTAQDFSLNYYFVDDQKDFDPVLTNFFVDPEPAILEMESSNSTNQVIWEKFKKLSWEIS